MSKFHRTVWKTEEVFLLQSIYNTDKYPDKETLSSIAVILNKPQRKVKIWFQNKRQRAFLV